MLTVWFALTRDKRTNWSTKWQVPTSADPTGADSPLLKHTETLSQSLTTRLGVSFKCSHALNNRAPSMCIGMEWRLAMVDRSSSQVRGRTWKCYDSDFELQKTDVLLLLLFWVPFWRQKKVESFTCLSRGRIVRRHMRFQFCPIGFSSRFASIAL